MSDETGLNRDFREFVESLTEEGVRFLIVGAHALAALGVPRATGDLDIWIECSASNAAATWRAMGRFGVPLAALGITERDFATPDMVVQIGQPPRRIDVMTGLSGVSFAEAWPGRSVAEVDGLAMPFLGREAFVRNKRAAGRLKDLADLEAIGASDEAPD